jgi:adenylate cyclase
MIVVNFSVEFQFEQLHLAQSLNEHMNRSRFLLLLIFIFSSSISFSQDNAQVDSLNKAINAASEDTNKVNGLIKLSGIYLGQDNDKALKYANEAKDLADKIKFQEGKAWALKKIGQVYNIQADYVNALQAWKEALAIFEANGLKLGSSNMLNNIGVVYYNKSMEDSAQDYYLRSLKVAEEIKDTLRIATALANLGGVFSNKTATYDQAIEYHHRALQMGLAVKDMGVIRTGIVGNSCANIGELYLNKSISVDTANAEASKRDIDSSLIYLLAARDTFVGSENLPYALNNLGKVYRQKALYDTATSYHKQAYEAAKAIDAKLDMGQALLSLAQIDTTIGQFKLSIPLYLEAEGLFKDIGIEESYDIQYVYEGLTAAYSALKDFRNAYKYQTMLIDVRKQIYNLEVDKKLGTKVFGYELGKKQSEINLQQEVITRQKLIRNSFIGGFLIVCLFAVVFFTQRNRISKEKKRSDELLLNILPEETAEELKATGSAKAKSFDMVSVLFTDFKNFTQASEKLSPADLVAEINYCYSEFDKIITNHGIEKIKTIGDAYMCAGGLPKTNSSNPVDVVQAGLEMVAFIEKNKQERIAKDQPYFELRCGVHTGPVVAGIVGIKKFAYDIWGDTVNTASRMESSGEIGKVNISGSTYDLVKDKFECIHRGKVKAKNKGEIDMYFVESRI